MLIHVTMLHLLSFCWNMKLFFSVVVPPFFHKKGHKEEKTNGDLISAYPLNCWVGWFWVLQIPWWRSWWSPYGLCSKTAPEQPEWSTSDGFYCKTGDLQEQAYCASLLFSNGFSIYRHSSFECKIAVLSLIGD